MSDRNGQPVVARLTPRTALTVAVYWAVWSALAAAAVGLLGWEEGRLVIVAAGLSHAVTGLLALWREKKRWAEPVDRIAAQVEMMARDPASGRVAEPCRTTELLVRSLNALGVACKRLAAAVPPAYAKPTDSGILGSGSSGFNPKPALTRSAMLETTSDVFEAPFDPHASGDYATPDMVNRLEPRLLRWLESSPSEQEFLGWNLRQLREKSFLEIVHPDDLARVKEQLRQALVKGETHGLILRIRTAAGKARAIEMNVGARYGPDMTVSHLRCHITDVTAKVRAERELKLRTREVMQVNEQLRLINRELEDLKERYRDLYQNAPAMYFSLDNQGHLLDVNDTLLRTLGYVREGLVGQSFGVLLPEDRRHHFAERFQDFLRAGTIELNTRWLKAGGEVIDVWLTGTAVRDASGRIVHSRSVAQDVTARTRLEAELKEKNARLARTIDELSRRNKEMDEFTYVVSHDLQEPLRTLIAFSDFLLKDYNDRLDAEGQEFVRYIVEASRRMRALIQDLLALSRVGKVTAEFAPVNLEEVVGYVRADLAELIRSKRAELRVAGTLPTLWGDRHRIGQLLTNLIANGLKYNDKAEPWVEVGVAENGETGPDPEPDAWATVYVRDNGIGIEPRFHTKIFQLFRRLHTREEYEGTGAGLAICDKIVQAHGGRIWVESEPNQGATFYLSLPRPPAGKAPSPPVLTMSSDVSPHAT